MEKKSPCLLEGKIKIANELLSLGVDWVNDI